MHVVDVAEETLDRTELQTARVLVGCESIRTVPLEMQAIIDAHLYPISIKIRTILQDIRDPSAESLGEPPTAATSLDQHPHPSGGEEGGTPGKIRARCQWGLPSVNHDEYRSGRSPAMNYDEIQVEKKEGQPYKKELMALPVVSDRASRFATHRLTRHVKQPPQAQCAALPPKVAMGSLAQKKAWGQIWESQRKGVILDLCRVMKRGIEFGEILEGHTSFFPTESI